jgi:hypothetical protein
MFIVGISDRDTMPELSVNETRTVSLGALIWEGKPQQRHTWNGAGQALAAVSVRKPDTWGCAAGADLSQGSLAAAYGAHHWFEGRPRGDEDSVR